MTATRCHGPGCNQTYLEYDEFFCSEACQARWHRQSNPHPKSEMAELEARLAAFQREVWEALQREREELRRRGTGADRDRRGR